MRGHTTGRMSYAPYIHTTAKRELEAIPDPQRTEIRDLIHDICTVEEPVSHPQVKHLEGHQNLMRIRCGDYRAISALEKPNLYVVKIGRRNTVYRQVDSLEERIPAY